MTARRWPQKLLTAPQHAAAAAFPVATSRPKASTVMCQSPPNNNVRDFGLPSLKLACSLTGVWISNSRELVIPNESKGVIDNDAIDAPGFVLFSHYGRD